MNLTNIQWCARHTVDPKGRCAHGATGAARCLDTECARCWVKGYSANPWIGCTPVSPACKNCWAEAVAGRMGLDVWGVSKPRHITGPAVFADVARWNRLAERTGQRRGVFWEDMGDLFEDRRELDERRARAFEAMEAAPGLDHMLLTKRPENIRGMVPAAWFREWPRHVWPGVTVEDQERADERIGPLLETYAPIKFLSIEPLLGRISFLLTGSKLKTRDFPYLPPRVLELLGLVIVGGESGPRPFDLEAAESIAKQCTVNGTALFMKQMGSRWAQANGDALKKGASHGQNPYRWPLWARRRELPGQVKT